MEFNETNVINFISTTKHVNARDSSSIQSCSTSTDQAGDYKQLVCSSNKQQLPQQQDNVKFTDMYNIGLPRIYYTANIINAYNTTSIVNSDNNTSSVNVEDNVNAETNINVEGNPNFEGNANFEDNINAEDNANIDDNVDVENNVELERDAEPTDRHAIGRLDRHAIGRKDAINCDVDDSDINVDDVKVTEPTVNAIEQCCGTATANTDAQLKKRTTGKKLLRFYHDEKFNLGSVKIDLKDPETDFDEFTVVKPTERALEQFHATADIEVNSPNQTSPDRKNYDSKKLNKETVEVMDTSGADVRGKTTVKDGTTVEDGTQVEDDTKVEDKKKITDLLFQLSSSSVGNLCMQFLDFSNFVPRDSILANICSNKISVRNETSTLENNQALASAKMVKRSTSQPGMMTPPEAARQAKTTTADPSPFENDNVSGWESFPCINSVWSAKYKLDGSIKQQLDLPINQYSIVFSDGTK